MATRHRPPPRRYPRLPRGHAPQQRRRRPATGHRHGHGRRTTCAARSASADTRRMPRPPTASRRSGIPPPLLVGARRGPHRPAGVGDGGLDPGTLRRLPSPGRFDAGDRILVSSAEYASNVLPLLQLSMSTGAAVEFIPDDDDGCVDVAAFTAHARRRRRPGRGHALPVPERPDQRRGGDRRGARGQRRLVHRRRLPVRRAAAARRRRDPCGLPVRHGPEVPARAPRNGLPLRVRSGARRARAVPARPALGHLALARLRGAVVGPPLRVLGEVVRSGPRSGRRRSTTHSSCGIDALAVRIAELAEYARASLDSIPASSSATAATCAAAS